MFIKRSIKGPDTRVQAKPQDKKNVVLYTPNNFARILAGIKVEAKAYDEAYIITSAAPIKKLPRKMVDRLTAVAIMIRAMIPIIAPNIKVRAWPNFLLNIPAESPIKIIEIERVFAIKLSIISSTAKPDSNFKNCGKGTAIEFLPKFIKVKAIMNMTNRKMLFSSLSESISEFPSGFFLKVTPPSGTKRSIGIVEINITNDATKNNVPFRNPKPPSYRNPPIKIPIIRPDPPILVK